MKTWIMIVMISYPPQAGDDPAEALNLTATLAGFTSEHACMEYLGGFVAGAFFEEDSAERVLTSARCNEVTQP